MKIDSSHLLLQSAHQARQGFSLTESSRFWATRTSQPASSAGGQHDTVQLSDAGKSAAADNEQDGITQHDPILGLIRSMIEYITGKRMKLFDASELQPNADSQGSASANTNASTQPGFGYEYHQHTVYTESETTSFSASGVVKTADGQEIKFDLSFNMSRSYVEETDTSIRMGSPAPATDPLVLNFAGTAAQLSDTRFSFDLNADGQAENLPQLGAGSGFLAFDRNHDGVINNGTELFGPQSGNGFQELAAFDQDGNGWIDDNDSLFNQLMLWRPDAGQGSLLSVKDAGVGAISLQHQSTPFTIKNSDNAVLGQVRSSGVFLNENGSVGSVQQIDLAA